MPNQSPINLFSTKAKAFKSYPLVNASQDQLNKNYSDLKDQSIHWNGHTSQLNIENSRVPNNYSKDVAEEYA